MANKRIVVENGDEAITDEEAGDAAEKDGIEENGGAPDPTVELQEKLAKAQQEAEENRDRMLRLAAELENFKKRSSRQMEELKKFATEHLIRQLLTVVDNLERAIASAPPKKNKADQGLVDGVALTLDEVMKLLDKHHVTPIKALGEPFDPEFHQAMSQEECADQPSNTVIKEFQKGYLLHDRLLRPSMVVVSKAVQAEQPNDSVVDENE